MNCLEYARSGYDVVRIAKMAAALYDVSLSTINEHIKRIYGDAELVEGAAIRNCRDTFSLGYYIYV